MANDMSKTASGTCARCQRPATTRCTGCLEAPAYDECFSKPTFYCSPVCQKADWGQHKSNCKKLQARKSLGRAALLLQAIIYRIRLQASPLDFKSLRLEGSNIFLDGFQLAGSKQVLKPFPVALDGDRSVAEAVLVYTGCTEALRYLHSFAKELLAELCIKIEEVSVRVTDQKLRIYPVFPWRQLIDLSDLSFHTLYRVTLKSGEVWAVDTTGTQYGYADPLCPWPGFERRRSCKLISEYQFGYVRYQFKSSNGMLPVRHMVAQMIEKTELTRELEEKVPVMVRDQGGRLDAILIGSDATFKQAKDRFLEQLENHLRAAMTKLYTPDQIARRNNQIEWQLSQNMTDPDRQKMADGLLKFVASAIGTPKGPMA